MALCLFVKAFVSFVVIFTTEIHKERHKVHREANITLIIFSDYFF
ncbi:MAG: hypothetical protein JWQ66_3985 [Mucilaginibacter sp.]|nr:hypothetical protein [Mucilaginibacter sp.]